MPHVFIGRRSVGIDQLRRDGLEAGKRKARRGGHKHEVACCERERRLAIDRQQAAAFQHRAETRMAKFTVAHTPAAGAADPFREHRMRPELADDFRERIDHCQTPANKLRTFDYRESGRCSL
jgi:hypothetical protein